jgi:hypothetical protein
MVRILGLKLGHSLKPGSLQSADRSRISDDLYSRRQVFEASLKGGIYGRVTDQDELVSS